MGMGWNLLRRKAVTLAAFALAVGWSSHAQSATGGTPEDPRLASVTSTLPVGARLPAVPPAGDDAEPDVTALRPVQGHRGEELYSIAMPDQAVIDRFLDTYLARKKDWLQAVLDRIPIYRGVITARIEELDLPRELLFLPAVESGFQITATSPRGAAGLWQLMANTASPFGLAMDQWVDERRDFFKATDASLRKLRQDFSSFGDWYLALAAYNCGASRLSRVVRQSGVTDYWTLRRRGLLPAETASFVPQFLAIAKILSYPGRYDLAPSWKGTVSWTRVPVARCVDLRILSREAGVPFDTLTRANAELATALTPPPSYRYSLKVPVEYRQAVEATLGGSTMPLLDFSIYVVKAGDTLSGIAQACGVTVDLLKEFNPAVRPLTLQIGARILVPLKGRSG